RRPQQATVGAGLDLQADAVDGKRATKPFAEGYQFKCGPAHAAPHLAFAAHKTSIRAWAAEASRMGNGRPPVPLCWAAPTRSTFTGDRGKMVDRRRQMLELTAIDAGFLRLAYEEAKAGFDEGGCPIGSVLAEGERLIARGRNQRVQQGDPIAHGEMDCLRKAGRQKSYRRMTLYTSLSPCMMCTGTIIQFGIPRVVIGEAQNFPGNPEFLRQRGVEVVIADDPDCIALMARFIRERPQLWNEDIMED